MSPTSLHLLRRPHLGLPLLSFLNGTVAQSTAASSAGSELVLTMRCSKDSRRAGGRASERRDCANAYQSPPRGAQAVCKATGWLSRLDVVLEILSLARRRRARARARQAVGRGDAAGRGRERGVLPARARRWRWCARRCSTRHLMSETLALHEEHTPRALHSPRPRRGPLGGPAPASTSAVSAALCSPASRSCSCSRCRRRRRHSLRRSLRSLRRHSLRLCHSLQLFLHL